MASQGAQLLSYSPDYLVSTCASLTPWNIDGIDFRLACTSIVTPVLFSIVFYLSNGRFKISYIDSLFVCVSAMTVTGLATVDLSELTPWQQTLIFMQMCIGTPVRCPPRWTRTLR